MTDAVLGYGSLVADLGGGRPAVLHGGRRAWTVAMDNTVDLPGYKHYLAPDGSRPDVAVAFRICEPTTATSVACSSR